MELQSIEITKCHESPTNPRGTKFEGPEFDELVASIKEKGVLMPVLARPIIEPKGRQRGTVQVSYEIVAGNRRLRAAKAAGLTEIPTRVVEMTDVEAREAQIVENLQRADVHPLEEGAAYRQLIEQSGHDIAAVAAKVGKSESYVRDRLVLTNLIKAGQTMFRAAYMHAGHAALIARLDEKQQKDAVTFLKVRTSYNGTVTHATTKELRAWIQARVFEDSMKNPPWQGDEAVQAALGGCNECKGLGGDLFGKKAAEACTNPTCYANRIAAFIEIKLRENPELVKISGDWSSDLDLPTRGQYKVVESTKNKCQYEQRAIVAEGENFGHLVRVCMDGECTKHWKTYDRPTDYKPTAKEIAARKRQAEAEKRRKAKDAETFQAAIAKIKAPLSDAHIDALFEFALYRCGGSYKQPAVKLLGLDVIKKPQKSYMDPKKTVMHRDYEATLRKHAEVNGRDAKLRVAFSLLMPHPSSYGNEFAKAVKRL